ncbi:hypothetical protein QT969_16265 [Rhodococcus sp. CSLK01-03]|uniref:YhcG N-terminal domain-containing protein n=1 Tax=Rhodococcus indonesiensis TaxID=3055869 RepID=A0ABT7RS63_9NOCA|nr:hypothetical protein [Rhodococcus indonesiensis]MDM7489836.1 hypothetical protein [Rhodococcus indonesiensis]
MVEMERTGEVGDLFGRVLALIEQTRPAVATQANAALTLMNWKIGHLIDTEVLVEQRAEYAQEIIVTPSRQLSCSSSIALIAVDHDAAQAFCIQQTFDVRLGVRARRELIGRHGFERRETANAQTSGGFKAPLDTFSDPYSSDFLELTDVYMDCDFGGELLREIETFFLEVGNRRPSNSGAGQNRWRCTRTASSRASTGRRCNRKKSRSSGSRSSIALRKRKSHAAHSVWPAMTRTTNE